ncbi:hypothetical protein like AT2G28410 [Hibiscus trionum]|uniref:Transmembrane protein n=1 Tax=Hibiscus trionum TaxID=183268 RepID=A0A9W7MBH9_HIBTR|nr:hypothetical protein like AT2G28410 [Hibiscus trionum]
MSPFSCFLLLLSSLALVSIANGQDRAPHGIANENPTAFSPSAYEFFHPKARKPDSENPCATSNCSPLSIAAEVDASKALETRVLPQHKPGHGMGGGAVAAIVFGSAFVALSAMGVFYVLNSRGANAVANPPNTVQPDV